MPSSCNALTNHHKRSLPSEVREQLREWDRSDDRDPVVRRANLITQAKILAIHAAFGASLAAYLMTGGHAVVVVASIVILGPVALTFLEGVHALAVPLGRRQWVVPQLVAGPLDLSAVQHPADRIQVRPRRSPPLRQRLRPDRVPERPPVHYIFCVIAGR